MWGPGAGLMPCVDTDRRRAGADARLLPHSSQAAALMTNSSASQRVSRRAGATATASPPLGRPCALPQLYAARAVC